MFEEVRIRERKSMKHEKTYEYRFEIAPVGGERKWLSKGGFLSEDEAKQAGIEAWKRYCLCGLSERPSDISYSDFLDEWMENDRKYNLKIPRCEMTSVPTRSDPHAVFIFGCNFQEQTKVLYSI